MTFCSANPVKTVLFAGNRVVWKIRSCAKGKQPQRLFTNSNIKNAKFGLFDLRWIFGKKQVYLFCCLFLINNLESYFQILALGNQTGKVFVWDLDVSDPAQAKCYTLQHPRCTSAIRQTTLSRNAKVLLYVCDDGTVWRWDKTT